jgi:hypothetical protein
MVKIQNLTNIQKWSHMAHDPLIDNIALCVLPEQSTVTLRPQSTMLLKKLGSPWKKSAVMIEKLAS